MKTYKFIGGLVIVGIVGGAFFGFRQGPEDGAVINDLEVVVEHTDGGQLLSLDDIHNASHEHTASCGHMHAAGRDDVEVVDPVVMNDRVAEIFDTFEDASSHRLTADNFSDLRHATVGDEVTVHLPGFDLSGKVVVATKDENITKVNLRLDDELGVLSFGTRRDGRLFGEILFNGEKKAFQLVGKTSDEWEIVATRYSTLYCLPSDTAFGMPVSASTYVDSAMQRDVSNATAVSVASFNSLPGADYVIYLDFDGELVQNTDWNVNYNDSRPMTVTPHPKANLVEFVRVVWARTAEDFMPFEVNVTTDRAVYDRADPLKRQMNIITTDQSWIIDDNEGRAIGGIAGLSSFGTGKPCWTFNDTEYTCADTNSHEVGHTLGLIHDGQTGDDDQYYDGHGNGESSWGPIMGAPFSGYDENVTQWSIGEYQGAVQYSGSTEILNTQDDLQVIANNGFDFRIDDAGNTIANAESLAASGSLINDSGIIERTGDIDFYSFYADEVGDAVIRVDTLDVQSLIGESGSETLGANLAVELTLYDSGGNPIKAVTPTEALGAELIATLPSVGTYYISVQGVGRLDPFTNGFSDYASLGQYTLSGNLPLGPLTVRGGVSFDEIIVNGDSNPSAIDGTRLGFATLGSSAVVEQRFTLENVGSEAITISSIYFSNTDFSHDFSTPVTMAVSELSQFDISFRPSSSVGIIKSQIVIEYYENSSPSNVKSHSFGLEVVVNKLGDDNYEQNNTYLQAFTLPTQVEMADLLGPAIQNDNDWYQFIVMPGINEVTINLDTISSDVGYDIYDSRGYPIISSLSGTLTLLADPNGGSYFIRVYGDNLGSEYDVNWSAISPVISAVAPEDNYEGSSNNDQYTRAFDISQIQNNGTLLSLDGYGALRNPDWYKLENIQQNTLLTVTLSNLNILSALNVGGGAYLKLLDPRGYPVETSETDGVVEQVTILADRSGTYSIGVYKPDDDPFGYIGSVYDLTVSSILVPDSVLNPDDDRYENNGNFGIASPISVGKSLHQSRGLGIQLDHDWYKLTLAANQNVLDLVFYPTNDGSSLDVSSDVEFAIYDYRGYRINDVGSAIEDEEVTVRATTGKSYYVYVSGANIGSQYNFSYTTRYLPENDDVYELNNFRALAYDLSDSEARYLSAISEEAILRNEDWYKILAQAGDEQITIEAEYDRSSATMIFELWSETGVSPLATSTSSPTGARLSHLINPSADEPYYIRVYGSTAGAKYDMNWKSLASASDDFYEENDDFDGAYELPRDVEGVLSDIGGDGIALDPDYYKLYVPANAYRLGVLLTFSDSLGDLDLYVYDEDFDLRKASLSVSDNESVVVDFDASESEYFYIVTSFQFAGNPYDMEWQFVIVESGDADGDLIGDAWEKSYSDSIYELQPDDVLNRYPIWAEYALSLEPSSGDDIGYTTYEQGGYLHMVFKRNKEAYAAGYVYTVIESESLDFDVLDHAKYLGALDRGDHHEVIYRSNYPIGAHEKCFFRVVVTRPSLNSDQ